MHHFTPQITSLDFEIHASQWQQKDVTYDPSKVILFKGVPEDIDEAEILSLCEVFGIVKDIFVKKQKRYVFLQFDVRLILGKFLFLIIIHRESNKLKDVMKVSHLLLPLSEDTPSMFSTLAKTRLSSLTDLPILLVDFCC